MKAYLEITMTISPDNRPAGVEAAQAYLTSELFQNDVFVGLKPLWDGDPDVRIYGTF